VLPPSAIKKPRHASGALEIIMIPAIVPLFKKKNLSDGAHYLRHLAALDSIPKFAAISEGCSNSEQRQRPRYGGRINELRDWGLGNTYRANGVESDASDEGHRIGGIQHVGHINPLNGEAFNCSSEREWCTAYN
jgi:hypothetical protein